MPYKVRTIQFTIEETFTIETDLYDSDAEAINGIKADLESGNLLEEERYYIGWHYSKVKIARD